jgi:VIT1/CCC1 family predicted Fe2+/Mn2+ transporter
VLGANDGLVSNLSLVMGVAGAELRSATILVTGVAGLLAGALSMAMGEWISVQSSRELYAHQLEVERLEIATMPELETEQLALIYRAKGVPDAEAHAMAERIMRDERTALDAMAREELGFDPDELGGSAGVAAVASFVPFTLGAAIPVLPFALLSGTAATVTSIAASACGLFVLGGAITLLTHRGILRSGARQVTIGLAAAGVTFAIGRLVGVDIA